LGYPPGEIEPCVSSWEKLLHPDDAPQVLQLLRDHLAGLTAHYISEHRMRTKSGEYKWILARGQVVARDVQDRPLRIVGTHVDITEQKRVEKEVRANEEKFSSIFHTSPDPIVISRLADGIILEVNEAFTAMLGYSADDAIGHLGFDQDLVIDIVARLSYQERMRSKGELVGFEVVLASKKGNRLSALISAKVLQLQGEKCVLTVVKDVTERKQLEAKLLRAQRLESIGTLASGIAHDLNNVLAPILMSIQYLREKIPDPESQTMLVTLEASAQRGANIVRQVLSFARGLEGERMALQPKYLINEILKIAQETFPKTITIRAACPSGLWAIYGDATQLHQVLMNLCVNARDAIAGGGTIIITAENSEMEEYYARQLSVSINPPSQEVHPGSYVLITVADTGPGISPEILNKIFDPFFTTKKAGQGTGLGLSTALSIIRNHGGFMQVQTEVGNGARFKIYLPATLIEPLQTATPEAFIPYSGEGRTILIVDDEESVLQLTKRTLEKAGYQVIVAHEGTEAVTLFAQNRDRIDLVLTDMIMPVMDGVATVRALRKISPQVKVVIASGMMAQSSETANVMSKVHAYIRKPFTAEDLLRTLKEVFEKN
jgi:two-component system, cell cycle sensor histidine kinase and response regulator CckA